MKIKVFILLVMLLITSSAIAKDSILVFAGAGMRDPLIKAGKIFEERFGIEVIYDFEGAGRLSGKILLGQRADVFIPGSLQWADQLREDDGYVLDYKKIAKHIPVIITAKGRKNIKGLDAFNRSDITLVLGDERACAIGRVGKEIFKKSKQKESNMNIKARGATVKQLVLWVEMENADASIVWLADARQSKKVDIICIQEEFNLISAIPVCFMRDAPSPKQAENYIEFLLSEGINIFSECGFEVCSKGE